MVFPDLLAVDEPELEPEPPIIPILLSNRNRTIRAIIIIRQPILLLFLPDVHE